MKKILIVEDNEDVRFLYRRMFRREKDIQLEEVDMAEAALDKIPILHPDLVLIDISLPGINGLDLTRKVRTLYPEIGILIVTGHETTRYYDAAINSGADDLVSKEFGVNIVKKCRKIMDR